MPARHGTKPAPAGTPQHPPSDRRGSLLFQEDRDHPAAHLILLASGLIAFRLFTLYRDRQIALLGARNMERFPELIHRLRRAAVCLNAPAP